MKSLQLDTSTRKIVVGREENILRIIKMEMKTREESERKLSVEQRSRQSVAECGVGQGERLPAKGDYFC